MRLNHQMTTLGFLVLPAVLLSVACSGVADADGELADGHELSQGPVSVVRVTCNFARKADGTIKQFASRATVALGPAPRVTELVNEADPTSTNTNPVREDADTYLRAASGIRFVDGAGARGDDLPFRVVVAQDSRRKLGYAAFPGTLKDFQTDPVRFLAGKSPTISVLAVDDAEAIAKLEDDTRDYSSYRKKNKKDFEASTTLPTGELLVLGSGSDVLDVASGKPSNRSTAILVKPAGDGLTRHDLLGLYKAFQGMPEIVGPATAAGAPALNIEGVAVRPSKDAGRKGKASGFTIAFFHRGNQNGNGHNAVVELDYAELRRALDASVVGSTGGGTPWAAVTPRRVVQVILPVVASAADPQRTEFPITLNDALFGSDGGEPTYFMPVGAEAEYVDQNGLHQDGVVTFAGMLRWKGIDESGGGSCAIYQAPGDDVPGMPTRFGKVEGLASFDRTEKSAYSRSLYTKRSVVVGVTDVDSEIKPASLSVLDFRDLD